MDVFGVCKVLSVGLGMASGACGLVASVPELKSAMEGLKKNKEEEHYIEVLDDGVEVVD